MKNKKEKQLKFLQVLIMVRTGQNKPTINYSAYKLTYPFGFHILEINKQNVHLATETRTQF